MLKQSQKVEHWNDARNLNQTHTSAQSSWGGGGERDLLSTLRKFSKILIFHDIQN